MYKVKDDDKAIDGDRYGLFATFKLRFAHFDKFYLRKYFMLEKNEGGIIKDPNETELK
jgi:hypothetical protein